MIKKNLLLLGFLIMSIFSVNADIPYFFSQNPTIDNYNSISGLIEFSYDIGQDGVGFTTAINTLYLNNSGNLIQLSQNSFTTLSSRDFITDNFSTIYNGNYIISIDLIYEDNISETINYDLLTYTFNNGIDYVVVNNLTNSGFFTSFLTDIGNGLGNFLTAIQNPLIYFILTLSIGGSIIMLIRTITNIKLK